MRKYKIFDQWGEFIGYIKQDIKVENELALKTLKDIAKVEDDKERTYLTMQMLGILMIVEKCVADEAYARKYFGDDINFNADKIDTETRYILMLTGANVKVAIEKEDS